MIHKHLSMGKVAILFEDIKELELANLDVGHSATEANKRTIVTSLIFRFVHKTRQKKNKLHMYKLMPHRRMDRQIDT